MAAGGDPPTGGPGPSRSRLPAAHSSAEPSTPGRRLQVHQDRQEVRPGCQNNDIQTLIQFSYFLTFPAREDRIEFSTGFFGPLRQCA